MTDSVRRFLKVACVGALIGLPNCAYLEYPGQPGVVTNGYSKIDYEYLDFEGLWVYEVSYDNTDTGKGVGAIVSKFYPGAQTYTSNVRYNSEGTLYRAKGQYDGAEVQAIVIPSIQQIIMPPKNNILAFMSSYTSENEVDDRNIAEEDLFKAGAIRKDGILKRATRFMRILKAGRLNRDGNLSFYVTALDMDGHKLELARPVHVQTNIFQNAAKSDATAEEKRAFLNFFNTHFPKGFGGMIKIHLQENTTPLELEAAIHSVASAKAVGYTVIERPQAELRATAQKMAHR